ncbi:putative reverse transcriptase domain-containing protein, partial [Tanacetum coccineum]
MAKSSSSSDNEVYDDSFCSKSCKKNTENLNKKVIKLNEELSDCETDLGGIDQGEVNVFKGDAEKDSSRSTDKGSESTGDLANVLSSMRAANILASGDPTANVLTTARDTTPYTRRSRALRGVVIKSTSPIPISIPSAGKEDKRKGKEIMTEPEKPAKAKVQEQMSLQLARELQEEFRLKENRLKEMQRLPR